MKELNISKQVLLALYKTKNKPYVTSKEVAEITGLSANKVNTSLYSNCEAGKITKTKLDKFVYSITKKGEMYLEKLGLLDSINGKAIEILNNLKPRVEIPEEAKENLLLQTSQLPVNLDDLVKETGKKLADQIIVSLEFHLKEWIDHRLTAMVSNLVPKIQEPVLNQIKKKKPHVMIVGLLGSQVTIIEKEFSDKLDIYFWNDRNGDGIAQLKSHSYTSAAVFVHIDHCKHATENTLTSAGAKVIRVPGGMSSMRLALAKFYDEQN